MAEYCLQCNKKYLGFNKSDFEGLVSKGEFVKVLCEGCGHTLVNYKGKSILQKKDKKQWK